MHRPNKRLWTMACPVPSVARVPLMSRPLAEQASVNPRGPRVRRSASVTSTRRSGCSSCHLRHLRHRARRVLHDRGVSGLRQDHLAAHSRLVRSCYLRHHRDRHAELATPGENWMIFQGEFYLPVDDGVGHVYGLKMRRLPAATIREVVGHYLVRTGLTRFADLLSASALGRHAPTGVDRARVRQRPGNPAMDEPFSGNSTPRTNPAAGGVAGSGKSTRRAIR